MEIYLKVAISVSRSHKERFEEKQKEQGIALEASLWCCAGVSATSWAAIRQEPVRTARHA